MSYEKPELAILSLAAVAVREAGHNGNGGADKHATSGESVSDGDASGNAQTSSNSGAYQCDE